MKTQGHSRGFQPAKLLISHLIYNTYFAYLTFFMPRTQNSHNPTRQHTTLTRAHNITICSFYVSYASYVSTTHFAWCNIVTSPVDT